MVRVKILNSWFRMIVHACHLGRTKHLWFSFRDSKNSLIFLLCCGQVWKQSFEVGDNRVLLTLLSLLLLLLLLFSLLLPLLLLLLFLLSILLYFLDFLLLKGDITINSFTCSYNITIVIFTGWRFIRKNFTIFAVIVIIYIFIIIVIIIIIIIVIIIVVVVVIIIIIIIIVFINVVKNITRIFIFRNIGRTVTSFMKIIIIIILLSCYYYFC